MRFTRWWNPSLPQTLMIATMLLYVNAVMSFVFVLGLGFGGTGYLFLPAALWRSGLPLNEVTTSYALISLVSGLVYGYAALALANGRRFGWKLGVAVAAGAVALPVLAAGLSVLTTSYVLSFIFDVALLVALLHPQSREYAKIWLDGGDGRRKGPRRLR